jgi:probable HAF family extracellular repeat protein
MERHSSFAARFGRWIVVTVCLLSSVAFAERARQWTVVEITPDSPGGGYARALNNAGDVVGGTLTLQGIFSVIGDAYVWRHGVRQDIGSAAGRDTATWDINERGTIVGTADGIATRWVEGVASSLQVVGQARGINARGDIVGQFWTGGALGSGNDWPFLFRDGAIHTLPTLDASEAAAVGINDAGIAVGYSQVGTTNATHAVLWDNGALRDLETLGGRITMADAINNRGDIVGRAEDGAGRFFMVRWHASGGAPEKLIERCVPGAINDRGDIVCSHQDTGDALLYEDGAITTLNDLPAMRAGGWQTFTPLGINDRGWIVGTAWKPGVAFWGTALLLIPD